MLSSASRREDFRTICLIPHASKVMVRIIKKCTKKHLNKSQFEINKRAATRDPIEVSRNRE